MQAMFRPCPRTFTDVKPFPYNAMFGRPALGTGRNLWNTIFYSSVRGQQYTATASPNDCGSKFSVSPSQTLKWRATRIENFFRLIPRFSDSRTLTTSALSTTNRETDHDFEFFLRDVSAKDPKTLAELSERWLDNLERKILAGTTKQKLKPHFYVVVADRWAKSGTENSGENAERILGKMDAMFKRGYKDCEPNKKVFTAVLDAWAKSSAEDSVQRAEEILNRMRRLHEDGYADVSPNAVSYSTVISAYANQGGEKNVRKAVALLEEMVVASHEKDSNVHPNTITFNAVMNGLAKSQMDGAPEQAEALLSTMNEIHKSGNDEVCPNTVTYTSVVDCWARSGRKESVGRVSEILLMMEMAGDKGDTNIKPDTTTYSAVINTLTRQRSIEAAKSAEDVLQRMESRYIAGDKDAAPNVISYNTVINAWANSGYTKAPQRCEELLNQMIKLSESGRPELEPNMKSFSTVMNAWAKSNDTEKAWKAYQILSTLRSKWETSGYNATYAPSIVSYNNVLEACAYTRTRDAQQNNKLLRLTFQILTDLEQDPQKLSPSSVTYTFLLHACMQHIPQQDLQRRFKFGKQIFKRCSTEGLVTDLFLQKLLFLVEKKGYVALVGSTEKRASKLSKEWSRNVWRDKLKKR